VKRRTERGMLTKDISCKNRSVIILFINHNVVELGVNYKERYHKICGMLINEQ
jgi:hypothetical protein